MTVAGVSTPEPPSEAVTESGDRAVAERALGASSDADRRRVVDDHGPAAGVLVFVALSVAEAVTVYVPSASAPVVQVVSYGSAVPACPTR